MWKKSYIPFALCLLLLSCPPLAFAQSATDSLNESWQTFDNLILSLNAEIASLKQSIKDAEQSSNISITQRDELIATLQTQLKMREAELRGLKDRYALLKNGADITEALKKKLSADLKAARNLNTVLIITQAASIFFIGYLAFR